MGVGLTVREVDVFLREISQLSKIYPCTPFFEEPLTFVDHGCTFGDCGTHASLCFKTGCPSSP